jgi:hypothetical protein
MTEAVQATATADIGQGSSTLPKNADSLRTACG